MVDLSIAMLVYQRVYIHGSCLLYIKVSPKMSSPKPNVFFSSHLEVDASKRAKASVFSRYPRDDLYGTHMEYIYIVDILNRYKKSMVLVSMVDMLVDV
jgi:hypothetical protein